MRGIPVYLGDQKISLSHRDGEMRNVKLKPEPPRTHRGPGLWALLRLTKDLVCRYAVIWFFTDWRIFSGMFCGFSAWNSFYIQRLEAKERCDSANALSQAGCRCGNNLLVHPFK